MFRAVLVAFALLVAASSSMAKGIVIQSYNATSNRIAVFEDDERVAYLYLTKPGTEVPEKDAIAYSRIAPVEKVDWKKVKKTGEAPPLSRNIASPAAIIKSPEESEFSFRWSANGKSVALLRKGEPIAFASATEKFGYSKAVAKPSLLAKPWDQKRYEALFGKSA